jgi:hypothetical protein
MKKTFACAAIVCTAWLCWNVDAKALKTTELNQKMSEISSLQEVLAGKIALATEKRNFMEQKILELKEEIKSCSRQLKIPSYQTAVQIPRIDYNLQLVQLLLGYISRLNERIRYFEIGQETLGFFLQQAEDDLMMIKTLNDLETDKLISRINEVLDEYIPESNKSMFDVNDVPLKDTEKIWHEISAAN